MRIKRIHIGLMILVSFLPFTPRVFGWGYEAHEIIAHIADKRLSDPARKAVNDLLGDQATMASVATWADIVRPQRPETGPWHYVSIPADADKFDEARDGDKGKNVIDALNRLIPAMTDQSKSKQERTEALKFVIHFVGDIHQPLHCAERNHDYNGNKRLVFFLDTPKAVNLHSVWDTSILKEAMGKSSVSVYASGLNARITSKQEKDWAAGKPEDWANESHTLAVVDAYKNVPADGPPPKLGRDYVDANEPVVNEQLQRAGVRLAMVLNKAFGN